jgi:site-specific recombinase XerD
MNDLLARYLDHLEHTTNRFGRTVAPATVRAARADLHGFFAWCEERHRLSFDPSLVLERDLRDWQAHRQKEDGARPSTINRAGASLRGFFAWAQAEGMFNHNPAAELRDLPLPPEAPRGLSPEAVEWLFRVAYGQQDKMARARDLALLTLLSDCGMRSQEAADLQLRDLDLRAETVIVRAGKGGKARRLPIEGETVKRLREYLRLRCPSGLPSIGSDAEREPLLFAQQRASGAITWRPGMKIVTMRKRLTELGKEAVEHIEAQKRREPSLARIGELEDLARELGQVSPHQLRHGLAYRLRGSGYDPGYIQRVLGHSRIATALRYGQPTESDARAALHKANSPPTR